MLALRNNQIAPSAVPVVPAAPVRWALTAGCVSVALLLAACGKGDGGAGASGPGGARPAPEVGVVTVTPSTVGLVNELPGRLEASRLAQVRARTAGILQKRLFTEGSEATVMGWELPPSASLPMRGEDGKDYYVVNRSLHEPGNKFHYQHRKSNPRPECKDFL